MALNTRRFRTGRVLTNSSSLDEYAILLESSKPNEWTIVFGSDILSPAVKVYGSHWLAMSYDKMLYGPSYSPKVMSIAGDIVKAIEAYSGTLRRGRVARQLAMAIGTGPIAIASAIALPDPEKIESPAPSTKKASRAAKSAFSVPKLQEDPYWYESGDDENLYRDFISLRNEGHTVNLLIAGPSGSGKTVGIQRLGRQLGIPVHIVNCQAITTPEKWLGQMHADVEKGTYFEPSQHIQWVERSHEDCDGFDQCIILYDEITRLRPELNNMTYSLFDTQRGLEVPQMGRRIMMDPMNIIVATANIGTAFSGTHTQDRAFRERFSLTMERSFPPQASEVKILTSATGIDQTVAKQLVTVANQSRDMWKNEEVESPISTRTLLSWALLVAGGYSPKKAADYTVLPMYSDDGGTSSDRAKISGSIEAKVSSSAGATSGGSTSSDEIPF